jgi:hypothetical protein
LPSSFTGDGAAKVTSELAEAQAKFAKARRGQTRIKHNANVVDEVVDPRAVRL